MIIICDPDGEFRASLIAQLDDQQVSELGDLAAARAAVDQAVAPTVIVAGVHIDPDAAMSVAAEAARTRRPAAMILVRDTVDTALMRRALRADVSDVLAADELAGGELTAAVDSALDDARARVGAGDRDPEGGERGQIVTVFSTKGGCGKSLVASNLAILLHQAGQRVALVDLDLQSGDLAIMLQVMPSLSIYDAAQTADRMDAESLAGFMTPHASGIHLLAAPMEPSLSEAVNADAVSTMLVLLRDLYDVVVVDGPAFFTDQVLAAIDQSAHVVLVGSLDVPSVKNLRTALNTLHQLGHHRDQILTVLNRADSNVGLRVSEVEKSLGTPIDVQLPSSRDVPLSINQGAPLAADRKRSDVVDAIARLVPSIAPEADVTGGSKSLFSWRR